MKKNPLDVVVDSASRRRRRAALGAPPPVAVAEALAERRASAAQIVEAAAEVERLGRVNEALREDIARFQQRVNTFRALGKGRLEKQIEEYDQRFGITVQYEPLRSVRTGDEFADEFQQNLDELQAALDANEQKIRELLAD